MPTSHVVYAPVRGGSAIPCEVVLAISVCGVDGRSGLEGVDPLDGTVSVEEDGVSVTVAVEPTWVVGVVVVVVAVVDVPIVVVVVDGSSSVVVSQWSSFTPPCLPCFSQSLPLGLGSGRHFLPVAP